MRVLVAGASGVVGRCLVPQLLERGHEVIGTTRRPDSLHQIERVGANSVLLDGLDAAAVGDAVARTEPDAIIHQMTALKGTPDFKRFGRWFATTNQLRTKGTQNLLDAARATGSVRKFVVQSYTGWTTADSPEPIATEDEPFNPTPLPQQRETQDAIERMEHQMLDSPIESVVLRYANLYSADAMAESVKLLKKRQFPIVGDGAGIWSWLHAEDAARATLDALEKAEPGVFNVADDDPAPVRDWLPYLAQTVGAPKPMRVPVWLAKLIAGDVAVRMMTRNRGVSNAKIKRKLGWQPAYASWREGFRTLIEPERTKELAHALS